jgi:hypothetical protein
MTIDRFLSEDRTIEFLLFDQRRGFLFAQRILQTRLNSGKADKTHVQIGPDRHDDAVEPGLLHNFAAASRHGFVFDLRRVQVQPDFIVEPGETHWDTRRLLLVFVNPHIQFGREGGVRPEQPGQRKEIRAHAVVLPSEPAHTEIRQLSKAGAASRQNQRADDNEFSMQRKWCHNSDEFSSNIAPLTSLR